MLWYSIAELHTYFRALGTVFVPTFKQRKTCLPFPDTFTTTSNIILPTFTWFNFPIKKVFLPFSRLWAIGSSDLSRTAGSVCIQRGPGERVGWTSNTWWWWAWWSCSRRQSEVTYCFPQEGKEKCCAIDADVPTGLDDGRYHNDGLSWQWWW